ncbi:alanine racemase C-terminal domain-containing protein [Paramicrobacterium agarici]|uniref:alanine racemase C-terminal domain-containing protein n=1 Tax=Paramicrobacterium agarici TaxID=630514 RepID=UPI0014752F78|nr:alanine racemase C-terminal domain-containing protein [Microbacterium agarici]
MTSESQTAGTRVLHLSSAQLARVSRALDGDEAAAAEFDSALSSDPVRLLVEVLSTKSVPAGSGVSYGHTFVTQHPTVLARVAIGYGHGLPRKAGNRAWVTWSAAGGPAVRLPIVGRVAMDEFVVDVGRTPVEPGQLMCVFGDSDEGEVPLGDWAAAIGESPVSVIACLDRRVTRSVVE